MKSIDVSTWKYVDGLRTYKNGVLVSRTDAKQSQHYALPSPLVPTKGNFVAPNNWAYVCWNESCWTGVRTRLGVSSPAVVGDYYQDVGSIGQSNTVNSYYPAWDMRTSAYNAALEKLNAKVRGGLDLGVTFAEAGATWRMIKALREFRRFSLRRLGGMRPFGGGSKDLANGLLQLKYGWIPLLSDIFGVADELVRTSITGNIRYRARSTFEGLSQTNYTNLQVWGVYPPVSRYGRLKQSCTLGVVLKIPSNTIDIARWTSLNPVSLGWELVPYSFVVDWFYDVGSYLRNLETAWLYNSQFVTGYKSELYAFDGVFSTDPWWTYTAGGMRYTVAAKAALRRRQFARTVLTSYPLPARPRVTVDLSWQRVATAGALLRQLFK